MISKKVFEADGTNFRFLSDFIIRSEQFCRVYNYVYDPNGVDGSVDPETGLYIRTSDTPSSEDLVTIDKWDLVDNSISFYTVPHAGVHIYIEVATTAEEFGDTLVQPSVEKAEEAAIKSQAWAEGTQPGGPGTYSSKEWAEKSETIYNNVVAEGDVQIARVVSEGDTQVNRVITEGNTQVARAEAEADRAEAEANRAETEANRSSTEADRAEQAATDISSVIPNPVQPSDEGKILTAHVAGNEWEDAPISLPDATSKAFNELATDGSASDAAEWSPFRMSPKTIGQDHTIVTGSNATIGSFTLEDTYTITVEDGASLIVV